MAMIVLPLFFIPLIFTVINKTVFSKDKKTRPQATRLAVQANGNGAELIKRFQLRRDLTLIEEVSPYDFEELILEDSIDFGLIISEDFDTQVAQGATGELTLFYNGSSARDTIISRGITKTISAYRRSIVDERLAAVGKDQSILRPTNLKTKNINAKRKSIGFTVGGIIPMFFVMFCFMGAMYPSIDLFTGEKERGTIETLLVLPANRFQLLIGKLLVIIVSGVISGLLTFVGFYLFLLLNPGIPFITNVISLESIFWIMLMMIPLTTFFGGVLIPISIYARSFKEAQSLLQPLVIIIILPLIVAIFPSFELNLKTALIPIFNVGVACKAIVDGSYALGHLVLVYVSLFTLAGVGVLVAKRWFGDERNIFRV